MPKRKPGCHDDQPNDQQLKQYPLPTDTYTDEFDRRAGSPTMYSATS
jgi:hypothetical protein